MREVSRLGDASQLTLTKRPSGHPVHHEPPASLPTSASQLSDERWPAPGQYETFIANGRVLAVGQAYNEPHSKIVREDLGRLAAEIAG